MSNGLEIEHKYLIRMPSSQMLEMLSVSEIEQIYLKAEKGSVRIRKRDFGNRTEYTYTVKHRLSDLTRTELEHEISAEEYLSLKRQIDPCRQMIRKKRYLYPFDGMLFEIDVFPFWTDRALMEIELEDEEQLFRLPPAVAIVREVTSDRRYANSSLAQSIPDENL